MRALANPTTHARLLDRIATKRRLTQLGDTFSASVDASTLGTVVVFLPSLIRLVQDASGGAAAFARAHRTTLVREKRLFHFAVEYGTLDLLARDVAHVAAALCARIQLPL